MQTRTAVLAAMIGLGTTSSVLAEPVDSYAPFVGSYRTVSVREGAARIERAIEQGTSTMNFVVRPIARKRLKAVNPMYASIHIYQRDGQLVTDYEGRSYVAGIDGSPRRNTDPDGSKVMVSYGVHGDTLVARYVAADGEKRFAFRRDGDRAVDVAVTLASDRLPKPISYELDYVRSP
jgi:hypothetical protein